MGLEAAFAKVSPAWAKAVGKGAAVKWPASSSVGGKGNEGVAGLIRQMPGAVGYVELIYALQNKIAFGSVQNAEGEFVKASVESVTAAAAGASAQMPADFRVSITNAPGKGVYPISSFTWLLLYESPKDKAQSKAMVDFVKWALTDGQKFCAELGYAPLPEDVVKLEMAQLAKIKVTGSAYCDARARLPLAALQTLLTRCTREMAKAASGTSLVKGPSMAV